MVAVILQHGLATIVLQQPNRQMRAPREGCGREGERGRDRWGKWGRIWCLDIETVEERERGRGKKEERERERERESFEKVCERARRTFRVM